MLFAFGLGAKVIAVGDYDRFPPEVENKQRIGGLLNPNIEKIIELKPDLVITYGSQDVLRERLESSGIQIYSFAHGNVEQTLRFMLELGRRVGGEDGAKHIVSEIRMTFDEIRASAPASRPGVLLVHNRGAGTLGSFYTVGSRAFQHDLIEIAGGRNLFGDVDRETLQPTLEEVISRKPDVIIETLSPPLKPSDVAQRKRDWESLGLAKGRIYIEGETFLLVPGPRLNLAARRFAEIIQRIR
jgi:iron complex transport system substrate-binding protein